VLRERVGKLESEKGELVEKLVAVGEDREY